MEPQNFQAGSGLAHTVFNPVIAIVVLIAALFLCFGPRNKAIVAFLSASFLIPMDQVLVIGSLHFPVIRIFILFGFVRMAWTKVNSRSEIFSGGVNKIDKAVILMGLFMTLDGILLWRDMAHVTYLLGLLYTAFGLYFLVRLMIRDEEDICRVIRVFACLMVVIAVFMSYERVSGTNLIYKELGGARSAKNGSAEERGNQFRAMGPFSQPILAGTFGAVMLPLFFALWFKDKNSRILAMMGMMASIAVAISANSSTALGSVAAGLFALCMWPLRKLMRPIRWGIALSVVSLHMVMHGPVWSLLARIDLSGGSDSYHRYLLVDQCIRHFWDWCLVGTRSNADWGWDMWDTANQYVATAESGGLIPLILFVTILVWGFKYLGRARKASEGDRPQELFLWAIGSALFANVVGFFGISYWDQNMVSWYALLAIITVATSAARLPQPVPQPEIELVRPRFGMRPQLAPGTARGRLSN